MANPAAWQGWVFHVLLLLGVVLALAVAVGGGAVGDEDLEMDDGGSPLDAGRVPFSLLLVMGFLVLGGVGVVVGALLETTGWPPGWRMVVAVVVATGATVLLTRRAARWLARVLPTLETYQVTRAGLVGRVGVLVLDASSLGGLCQVRDHEGNLHQVRVHTRGEPIPRGAHVVLLEHHASANTYAVVALDD